MVMGWFMSEISKFGQIHYFFHQNRLVGANVIETRSFCATQLKKIVLLASGNNIKTNKLW